METTLISRQEAETCWSIRKIGTELRKQRLKRGPCHDNLEKDFQVGRQTETETNPRGIW